jgi:HSP20 family molecular chaperone IbpA
VIRGRQRDDSEGRVFLHRGIAARQFQRAFVLAEGIEVEGAWLDNGLLHVDLRRPMPEPRVKTIAIGAGSEGARQVLTTKAERS